MKVRIQVQQLSVLIQDICYKICVRNKVWCWKVSLTITQNVLMKAIEISRSHVNTSLGNFITILFCCAEAEEGFQRGGHVHSSCLAQPNAVMEEEGKRGLNFTASCQCSFSPIAVLFLILAGSELMQITVSLNPCLSYTFF